MAGVGDEAGEWSMEEKFEHITEAGFLGVLGLLGELIEAADHVSLPYFVETHGVL
jgi:hypothetical protein